MSASEDFKNEWREKLKQRNSRLTQLLERDAPTVVIAEEVGMILEAGVLCFGEAAFRFIVRLMTMRMLEASSRCLRCFEVSDLVGSFCPKCSRHLLDDEKEADILGG